MYNFAISSGVASGDDFACSVSGGDNIVTVSPGIGWIKNNRFNGLVVGSKTQQTVDIGIPDAVYPRIDVVALQFDVAKNGTSLIVKKGTPATNPAIPERVTTESVYELYLCSVLRNPSATVVSASDVTDLRMNSAYCGLMANSITKIDTDAISQQVNSLIEDFRTAIADVEAGEGVMTQALWSKDGAIRVDKGGTGAKNGEQALSNLGVFDYIVAHGTADEWHWEMWKSGKAVCWCSHNFGDISVTNERGSWYESAGMTKDFPAGLFITAPDCLQINILRASNGVIVSQGWQNNISATNTGTFSLASIRSRTVKGVYLSFYAVGRWKQSDGSESELEAFLNSIIDLQEQYIGGEDE
jgi:hypothetical protein